MMEKLTQEESEEFQYLGAAIRGMLDGRVALVRSVLDGEKDVAVVALVEDNGDEEGVDVTPLAILIDSDLFARLIDPADAVGAVKE